jgi:pimeloyl-ACP methyl ester carboxylesterase
MKTLSLFGAAVLSGAVLAISATWSLSALGEGPPEPPAVTLPAPTGPFAAGRTIYEWTDASRDEMLSDVEGERRSVVVWVWYPAEASDAPVSEYLPNGLDAIIEQSIGLPVGQIHVQAQDNAPLAQTRQDFPVLVFSHGAGSLLGIYTAMLSEIASHGYVVVGIQHPYNAMATTFADGRVVPMSPGAAKDSVQYWSEDTAFVVDELESLAAGSGMFGGRLDLTRLGAFGHSFGGAASAEFCLDDPRCVAGINFDGSLSGDVEQVGVTQPFMQVFSGTTCEEVAASGAMTIEACLPMLAQYRVGWQRMFDASEVGYRLKVDSARHGSFSDLPFLVPLSPMFADNATITSQRAWEITTGYTLAFFNRHLNGSSELFPDFPEVALEFADRR